MKVTQITCHSIPVGHISLHLVKLHSIASGGIAETCFSAISSKYQVGKGALYFWFDIPFFICEVIFI